MSRVAIKAALATKTSLFKYSLRCDVLGVAGCLDAIDATAVKRGISKRLNSLRHKSSTPMRACKNIPDVNRGAAHSGVKHANGSVGVARGEDIRETCSARPCVNACSNELIGNRLESVRNPDHEATDFGVLRVGEEDGACVGKLRAA